MSTRRYFLILYALFGAMFLLAATSAFAQTSFPKAVIVSWKLPTTNADGTPMDPLTPITKVQVFLANASIANTSTMAPTVELGPTATTTNQTFTVFAGGSLFARVKVCKVDLCSDFSAQAAIPIPANPVKPGVPTEITLTLVPG